MYAWRSRCRQTYGRHPCSVSIEAMEYQVTGATTATSSTAACLSLCLSSLAFRVSPVSPRLPGWVAGGGGGQMMPRQGSLVVCFLFSCKQHPSVAILPLTLLIAAPRVSLHTPSLLRRTISTSRKIPRPYRRQLFHLSAPLLPCFHLISSCQGSPQRPSLPHKHYNGT